ncbi:hypothetical protein [Leptospira sp. GIMC2001]|uniref:hypothetical protein n=1 Tax=Leptospira sp. GIMC2001 TaxID=1513297 RepID=UPI002349DE80|nr:hypothetical protein [Leptospira sp. GIMC2001]WCL49991.1 hypothetical protein O4O04_04005 [Leptospira sp. GIMC2001]
MEKYFRLRDISLFFLTIILLIVLPKNSSLLAQGKNYKRDFFVPEPLNFDLIRNLGAKKGEIEGNILTTTSKGNATIYSPEIEYAFLDNHAVELEIAMEESFLKEGKFAYQWTMGTIGYYQHGIQTIAKLSKKGNGETYTALYLSAYKLNDSISFLMMNGFETFSGKSYQGLNVNIHDRYNLEEPKIPKNVKSNRYLWNGNLFYDMDETWIFGLEINYRTDFKKESEIVILPNTKYHLTKHTSFHLGLGLNQELDNKIYKPIFVIRAIVEF